MTRHIQILTTAAFIFGCGVISAGAQQTPPTAQTPTQPQQQQQTDQQGSMMGRPGGMMGPGMMGGGRDMMGDGMMAHGMMGGHMMREGMMGPMMSPLAMRLMFALMDGDGEGTVSLQEFQTAHERIFKAMDANKDGVLTLDEIQNFMRGTSTPTSQPSSTPTPQRP
jgi:hypothetical protein